MKKADLHIHSKFSSDGEFNIPDIVNQCAIENIGVFSITDHNSVKANKEAYFLAQKESLDFIPGIEIDCNYNGIDLHVLGYNIDWSSKNFETLENSFRDKTMESFSQMIDNLLKLGFKVDPDVVLNQAQGNLPTGELIAEVMLSNEKYHSDMLLPYMQGGARSDMPYINFYLDYFAQDKPAYVPVEYMPFAETIQLIKDNRGIPIVAHPGFNLKGKESTVTQLLDRGAAGLEVFNNYHNTEQMEYFASTVQKQNALMTCGSDFHGKTKPKIKIGQYQFRNEFQDYLYHSIDQLIN